MAVTDYLTVERITTQADFRSKRELLEALADALANNTESLDADSVVTALVNRERLGSTAMGHGVAIPHGRMEHLSQPVAALIQLDNKVDFRENQDTGTQNVDLVAGLIVPADATNEHLQLLANLAEMFVDESFCQQLRNCTSADELLTAMQQFNR